MSERTLPQGFSLKPVETKAGGVAYAVEVPQAESWRNFYDFWTSEGKNPDEILTAILNSANEQGAKQGQKEQVRQAGTDPDKLAAAIEAHQKTAKGFIMGAPRGGGGGGARHESGLTKKQLEALGGQMASFMAKAGRGPNKQEMDEICAGLGIDPKHLG